MNRRPQLSMIAPLAAPEEVAAVTVALERFMRETAPRSLAPSATASASPWRQAAIDDAVRREPVAPAPWE